MHQSDGPIVEHADGSVTATRSAVAVSSNDPNFSQAEANEQWAKVKQAIADGNYTLREAKETNGILVYLYDITLPDGTVSGFGSSRPIAEIQAEELSDAPDE